MRDMGVFCHRNGLNACSYAYPGATITDISNNVRSYLRTEKQPGTIVLHAGGNDLENSSVLIASQRMDKLIKDVKSICPSSRIILSAIPPRKQNGFLNLKIAKYNEHLQMKSNTENNITFVDCVPLDLMYYKYDKVHFNSDGKDFYSQRLAEFLNTRNFHKEEVKNVC